MSDAHNSGSSGSELAVEPPIADPGLPAHTWRPTDVDPAQEKRAERQVAGFMALSALSTIAFLVAYFTLDIKGNWHVIGGFGASTMALGATLGLALMFIGIDIIHWARRLMADHEGPEFPR